MDYDEKLDLVIKELTVLSTDMKYIKSSIEDSKGLPTRVKILETKVDGFSKIFWKIGTVCGTALLMAILALII